MIKCKLWRIFGRLQKKQLYEVLDNQIAEADRIGKKMDQYRLTLDREYGNPGEPGWFERVCKEHLESIEVKRKDEHSGACTTTAPCIINP